MRAVPVRRKIQVLLLITINQIGEIIKNKILILLTLVLLSGTPPMALAEERNFPAGSLIIPMDSFYQPDGDGGIMEAYGLAFYLLNHTTAGEHDITIYWVINEDKATISSSDVVIEDLTIAPGEAVAALYNHAGGTSALTFKPGDSSQRVSYSGAPFIVDGLDAELAKTVINDSSWAAVEVHVAQVPFAAPVAREFIGTPPRMALMNDSERASGSARINESYLRLAGICTDVYDVVTPNQIRDGILLSGGYDFLWVPHWDGYGHYANDNNVNGNPDVEDIVIKIREFLQDGKSVLAECTSIEVFEHSQNGRFLSTSGFGHDGGTNQSADIIYNDLSTPNSQIGDYIYVPERGHLRNWRPFIFGDPYSDVGDPPDEAPAGSPDVTAGNPSTYNNSVTRFTIDNTGWDYYVGGYLYGDFGNGYIVYLGGHEYSRCKGTQRAGSDPGAHNNEFEFKNDINDEDFTLLVTYDSGSTSTVTFNKNDLTAVAGDPLEVDLTTATVDRKKIRTVTFRNKGGTDITINSITFSWNNHADQKLKKITDKTADIRHYDDHTGVGSGVELAMSDFTIEAEEVVSGDTGAVGCTNNSDCTWKNIAGIRYVLSTLFNIKFQIQSREYVRAAPIVSHPYLYQGSFEYPSYSGHFRCYEVLAMSAEDAKWDTADGHIPDANTGNFDGRKVYTADAAGNKIDFDAANIVALRVPLNITPDNGNDADEIRVINRLRGKDGGYERSNKLGGIMHSAPVIVDNNTRTEVSRSKIAYVGDLYGMLHAIETATGNERWAFIPHNLLGKLKINRTDPNADQNFAAVDASPTVKEFYYDHDNSSATPNEWRTILLSPQGTGGKYIFALDVTDPNNFSVMWEATDSEAPGGGMGASYRAALYQVKSPVYGEGDLADQIVGYERKLMGFVATGYANIAVDHGGINVFAYDLETGNKLWHFSQAYSDAVNDIPGHVTLLDTTGDKFVDRLYVGDLNGRLWEVNALDGTNPNGTEQVDGVEKEIPLWNAGVGNPISVSPAVIKSKSDIILIFGTGGTDWAANDQSYSIFAVKATDKQGSPTYAGGAGTLLWEKPLAVGEKVWSSPTIAAGQVFVATSTGTMESSDARVDLAGGGNLYNINLMPDAYSNAVEAWRIDDIGKSRSSIYVDRQHVYLTTIDNQVIQVGGSDFSDSNANKVILKSWRHLY